MRVRDEPVSIRNSTEVEPIRPNGKFEFGRKIKMSKIKMSNGKIPKIKCRKVNMSKEKNVEREKYRKSVLPTIKRKYIVVLFLLKIFYFTMRKLKGEGVDTFGVGSFSPSSSNFFYNQVDCRSHNQFVSISVIHRVLY